MSDTVAAAVEVAEGTVWEARHAPGAGQPHRAELWDGDRLVIAGDIDALLTALAGAYLSVRTMAVMLGLESDA